MTTPILHHYPASPFSEKVRLILGHKAIAYRSVEMPAIMPKPDLVALTGGYRKAPVLQIGCDVYCDTRLIARVLEALAPEPTLYPRGAEASANLLAQWADQTLFFSVVPYAFQREARDRMSSMPGALKPEEAKGFMMDRIAFAKDAGYTPPAPGVAFSHLPVYLSQLDAQLGARRDSRAGGAFLLGVQPCIADFAVYHCLWFLHRSVTGPFEPFAELRAWMERMAALGHGAPAPLASADALEICKGAQPAALGRSLETDVNGIALGSQVQVAATDMGRDAVAGELVHLALDELVIRRSDPRAGDVHVHYPRIGYSVEAS